MALAGLIWTYGVKGMSRARLAWGSRLPIGCGQYIWQDGSVDCERDRGSLPRRGLAANIWVVINS